MMKINSVEVAQKGLIAVVVLVAWGMCSPIMAHDRRDDKPDQQLLPLPANPQRPQVVGKGLGFPFTRTKRIAEIRAFGIMPWGGEPFHGGMDIIVKNTGKKFEPGQTIKVVSPADGVIKDIIVSEDPDPNDDDFGFSVAVIIEVKPSLWAILVFEPKIGDAAFEQLQIDSIKVAKGDKVKQGHTVGWLVIGGGEGSGGGSPVGSGNPHIHYEVILKDPATTLNDILVGDTSFTDVWNLPTSICPYDYSSAKAKKRYEKVLGRADEATQCRCPCMYPYNHAACGLGCVD